VTSGTGLGQPNPHPATLEAVIEIPADATSPGLPTSVEITPTSADQDRNGQDAEFDRYGRQLSCTCLLINDKRPANIANRGFPQVVLRVHMTDVTANGVDQSTVVSLLSNTCS